MEKKARVCCENPLKFIKTASLVKMTIWILLLCTLFGFSQSVAPTFTLHLQPEIRSEDRYTEFIQSIRDEISDPNLHYGGTNLPVIKAPTEKFFRVDLVFSSGVVSVGILGDNLYLLTYMAKNPDGIQCAYYFLGEVPLSQLEELFPEAGPKNRFAITEYDEQYSSLEKMADIEKQKLGLGIILLNKYCEKVHLKVRDYAVEASFLLVSLQMISEATRFRYIEDQIVANFPDVFTLDEEVLILEKNWGTLSKKIKESSNGKFEPPISLTCDDVFKLWTVKTIEEVKIGVLKHCPEGNEVDGSNQKAKNVYIRDTFGKGPKQPSRSDSAAKNDKKGQSGLQCIERGKHGRNEGRSRGVFCDDAEQKAVPLELVGRVVFVLSLYGAIALIAMMLLLRKLPYPLRPGDLSKAYR